MKLRKFFLLLPIAAFFFLTISTVSIADFKNYSGTLTKGQILKVPMWNWSTASPHSYLIIEVLDKHMQRCILKASNLKIVTVITNSRTRFRTNGKKKPIIFIECKTEIRYSITGINDDWGTILTYFPKKPKKK